MVAMSIKESFAGKLNQELGSRVAGNIVFSDFAARVKRTGIAGIFGIASNLEAIRGSGLSNIIEFPKKGGIDLGSGRPRSRVEKVIDYQAGLVRLRRKSRCDGMHDAEEKPCGSPRCRTKGRQKLKMASATPDRKRVRKQDILKVNSRPFKRAA